MVAGGVVRAVAAIHWPLVCGQARPGRLTLRGRSAVFPGEVLAEVLPREDLLPYLEAVLASYNLAGRRDNKYKARIKILVHETGADEIQRSGTPVLEQEALGQDLKPRCLARRTRSVCERMHEGT